MIFHLKKGKIARQKVNKLLCFSDSTRSLKKRWIDPFKKNENLDAALEDAVPTFVRDPNSVKERGFPRDPTDRGVKEASS